MTNTSRRGRFAALAAAGAVALGLAGAFLAPAQATNQPPGGCPKPTPQQIVDRVESGRPIIQCYY